MFRLGSGNVTVTLGALACGACASLAGLSGGDAGGVDGGAGSRDGGIEARAQTRDASVADRKVTDGLADVVLASDGAPDVAAPKDATADRQTTVACDAETAFPDATSTTCSPVEAGSCVPATLPGYTDIWRAPHVVPSACTEDQISQFIQVCLVGADGGAQECTNFVQGASTEQCARCMLSDSTDTTFGPVILFSTYTLLNLGGCVALVDPCQEACAEVVQADEMCPATACTSNCGPTATGAEIQECSIAARQCSCRREATRTAMCSTLLSSIDPTAQCFPTLDNGGFVGRVAFMGLLFCGPPADAG